MFMQTAHGEAARLRDGSSKLDLDHGCTDHSDRLNNIAQLLYAKSSRGSQSLNPNNFRQTSESCLRSTWHRPTTSHLSKQIRDEHRDAEHDATDNIVALDEANIIDHEVCDEERWWKKT